MQEEPDEREDAIYHGTTLEVANRIVADKKFSEKETFFAATRDLAFYFADRSCGKKTGPGVPALIHVGLYASDLKEWTRNRLVASEGFDKDDAVGLRGKTQLIFSAEAVRLLNVYSFKDTWRVEVREKA